MPLGPKSCFLKRFYPRHSSPGGPQSGLDLDQALDQDLELDPCVNTSPGESKLSACRSLQQQSDGFRNMSVNTHLLQSDRKLLTHLNRCACSVCVTLSRIKQLREPRRPDEGTPEVTEECSLLSLCIFRKPAFKIKAQGHSTCRVRHV